MNSATGSGSQVIINAFEDDGGVDINDLTDSNGTDVEGNWTSWEIDITGTSAVTLVIGVRLIIQVKGFTSIMSRYLELNNQSIQLT